MTNLQVFLLLYSVIIMPSILWLSFLVWNAPELCDELRVDVRENDAPDNVLLLDVRRDEAKRMLSRMNSELPQ